MTRLARATAAALFAAVAIVSCGGTDTPPQPATLAADAPQTQEEMRKRSEQLLADTLAQLAPSLSLSLQPPPYSSAEPSNGSAVPCTNSAADSPLIRVGTTYWVIGVPPGSAIAVQDRIMAAWRTLGWSVVREGANTVSAWTNDNYRFHLFRNGYDGLAITLSSPCFPAGGADGRPMSATVTHP
ncbi:hypothetical protein ERC79_18480 [Rhodococcus sp. ABRD24]|uniref:hypothetical protein n=1 Tax=Rhodococcus sp. ABRD24 TaxID=2507582 RepID=UPI00103DEC40|nr:hypothetical protein [Rhodococcus sp. ABRD24]QBJ97704.1 hypothetical protein ERC79_18480 [Rhodococcus sp. ABRD24]